MILRCSVSGGRYVDRKLPMSGSFGMRAPMRAWVPALDLVRDLARDLALALKGNLTRQQTLAGKGTLTRRKTLAPRDAGAPSKTRALEGTLILMLSVEHLPGQ